MRMDQKNYKQIYRLLTILDDSSIVFNFIGELNEFKTNNAKHGHRSIW